MSKTRKVLFLLLLMVCLPRIIDVPAVVPVDPVTPPPITVDHLAVLIVEETADRNTLPTGQRDILVDQQWRAWVESHGGDWRVLDDDTPTATDEPWVQTAAAVPRTKLPWVVMGNGKSGYSGPLQADLPAFNAALLPLGGE